MKKNLLGLVAIVAALGMSAFDTFRVDTIYQYNTTDQTKTARETATNYIKVSSVTCSGTGNECAVTLTKDNGTNPDFSSGLVTFDATTGMPNGGSTFVNNQVKH